MASRRDLKMCVVLLVALLCIACDGVLGVCSVEHCTDPTRCLLSQDQRSCECTMGYYSDRCDRDVKMKVICGKDSTTIMAVEDYFQYHHVPLESVHLPNKLCRAQREVMDGVPFYTVTIPRDQYVVCGAKLLKNNITHAGYTLVLTSDPQVTGNIIRDPVIKLEFSCFSPYTQMVSLGFPVSPLSSDIFMRVDEIDAKIQMMLYTDQTYMESFSSAPTIKLGDKVYVEVRVTEPEDFFLMQVKECWATQSPRPPQPNSTEGLVHTLLRNGCADDETVAFVGQGSAGGNGESGNGESTMVRYHFDMLRFVTDPQRFYLHCSIQLCDPDDGEGCKPNCKSIKKRDAPDVASTLGLVSYGPIMMEMPEKSHSSVLMMVVLPVAGIWTVGLFVLILISVAKAGRPARVEEH